MKSVLGGCNPTSSSCDFHEGLLAFGSGTEVIIYNLQSGFQKVLSGHKENVNSVKFINNTLVSGSCDGKLIEWEPYNETSTGSPIINICGDENFLIILGANGQVTITEKLENKTQIFDFRTNLQESCTLGTIESSKILLLGGADAKVHLYSYNEEWIYQNSFEGHKRTVRALAFKQEQKLIVSAGEDGYIRIWKIHETLPTSFFEADGVYILPTLEMSVGIEAVLAGHTSTISSVKWLNENLVTFSHDFTVQIWQEQSDIWVSAATMGQIAGNKNIICGGCVGEGVILANLYTGGFGVWVFEEGEWTAKEGPTGHTSYITDIVTTPDFVITCSADESSRLWVCSNESWKEVSRPMIHGYDMNTLSINGNYLISGGDEKVLRVFELSSATSKILKKQIGVEIEASRGGERQALGLMNKESESEFDPDTLLTEDILNTKTLWPEIQKMYGHGYEVNKIASAHTEKLIVSACKAESGKHAFMIVWNLENFEEIARLTAHSLTVTGIEFSPDDSFILSVSRDRNWALFDSEYENVLLVEGHARMINGCAWIGIDSFVTVSRDRRLKIWNVGGEVIRVVLFKSPLTACCSVGEECVVVGMEDGTVSLLGVREERERVLYKHGKEVNQVKFNGNLFSVSSDHTLRVFEI